MWILGLKGLILLYIHVGKKVVVNNLLEIRSCKIVGVYYKILLKLQYNFSSNTFGPILWDIEKQIWRLSDEYFFYLQCRLYKIFYYYSCGSSAQ